MQLYFLLLSSPRCINHDTGRFQIVSHLYSGFSACSLSSLVSHRSHVLYIIISFFSIEILPQLFKQSIGFHSLGVPCFIFSISPFHNLKKEKKKRKELDARLGGAGVCIPTHALGRASRWFAADDSCEGKPPVSRRLSPKFVRFGESV